ncbi:MAG: aminopeptidase N [Pseudomonadota bacterium]
MKKIKLNYRNDYKIPNHVVETVDLRFELGEEKTTVTATMTVKANVKAEQTADLLLYGKDQTLCHVKLDKTQLSDKDYKKTDEGLTLFNVPKRCTVEICSEIKPQENTSLMGLYKSKGMFCTQCESEGFRKITYYPDRPDVLAVFTVTIIADKKSYPVLLANGNLVDTGDLQDGKHFAKWHDPFKKPCYLFALVAGDLSHIDDHFITRSGRKVHLAIYTHQHNIDKCHFAMTSLKKAMKWDEEHYGREYDLDQFMIVAVDDFNFGAMENKGLNIFNTQYILADPKTATDQDYANIDTVVAHEYFHNWSGNRVTLRDWFQLTLKEGLTVFRDHSFSESIGSAAVTRIQQVNKLRNFQFAEDHGPLAHPIRPDAYIEVSNFYTATVYEKGSEVIRMLKTILGDELYRRGTDLYFDRYDGQAVTCENFVQCMEEVGDVDLSKFRYWYEQAGTPVLRIRSKYDRKNKSFYVVIKQSCPNTPGQQHKKPFYIPLKMMLLDKHGKQMPLKLEDKPQRLKNNVLILEEELSEFTFVDLKEKPLASFLCGFSAPVKLHYRYTEHQLAFLMTHDYDRFCQWEAGERYTVNEIIRTMKQLQADETPTNYQILINAVRSIFDEEYSDKQFTAEMLLLPTLAYVMQHLKKVDIEHLCKAREIVMKRIASELEDSMEKYYQANQSGDAYNYSKDDVGRRHLKNVCLAYLSESQHPQRFDMALQQFETADNMTDQLAAFAILVNKDTPYRQQVIEQFYQQWRHEPLVIDKWFAIQALADVPDYYDQLAQLLKHKDFNIKNPNRARAVLASFTRNLKHFHDSSGRGYQLISQYIIKLDAINPMVASRLATSLTNWRQFDKARQKLMKQVLKGVVAVDRLSKDTYEIVSKSLAKGV